MRKTLLAVLAMLVAVFGACASAGSETAPLKAEDFRIGRLRLEQLIDEVIRIYGPPVVGKTIVHAGETGAADWQRYTFDGIELEACGNPKRVFDISVLRVGLKTPRNIGVGSKKGEVTDRYGKGYPMGMSLIYETYDPVLRRSYVLEFVIDHSRVARMEMRYAWE